ncbi:MAG: UDP-N-acetylmuramate dehydrogenase [Bacteroidales bacterium]|nr:UDP-N-acetylmuramate dehydrogenase [Bacteroidales bacterium]
MKIEKNKILTSLNTFKIKEYCEEFIKIEDKKELLNVDFTDDFLILGGGSNLLITKRLKQVIFLQTKGIKIISETSDDMIIKVEAGEEWDHFVKYSVDKNLYGAENLSFIPGTVGAAPIQNIGAYGAEAKDIIQDVEFFNITTKQFEVFENKKCNFEYRSSIFKYELKNKIIITSVTFKLSKLKKLNLQYGGLTQYFGEKKNITSIDVRDAVIAIRETKLPNTDIIGNSGSFFKNAIVPEQKLCELKAKYPNIPFFKAAGGFKIPTAWLIEKAGLKGFKHGNAGVYNKHALILVNHGGATAQEILYLSDYVENKVFELFGVRINKEVNIV